MILRDLESFKWHFDVPLDLGGLARDADFNPDTYLLIETMLYEICHQEFSCGMHGGMRQAMDVIKSSPLYPVITTGLGWPVETKQISVAPWAPNEMLQAEDL